MFREYNRSTDISFCIDSHYFKLHPRFNEGLISDYSPPLQIAPSGDNRNSPESDPFFLRVDSSEGDLELSDVPTTSVEKAHNEVE